jgi:lipopolysaccharide assembly outer membrane protein LptD (OstA)
LIKSAHILKIALLQGAFFLLPLIGLSQKGVLELLPGSDKLGYNEKTGAHRLVGSVNFNYQGNTMYCDSAHYFDKTQEVRAYGNVHIVKDEINLFCDSLYYNGKTRKAKLWGHVRVRDLEYKLTTDTLEYDAKKAQGIYRHGGKIESITSSEVLTSRVGYFYPESKSFFFSGKVKYKNEDLSMTTDTLQYTYSKQTTNFFGPTKIIKGETTMFCERGWYNIETEEGSLIKNARILQDSKIISGDTLNYKPLQGKSIARGNVIFSDTLNKSTFRGNYGETSEKEHSSFLTGNASAASIREKDTLFIFADTLFNQNDTLDKPLFTKGYHNVRFFNSSVQSTCDSIFYGEKVGKAELYKNPIVWAQNAELKGDSMTVYMNDSLVEWIHIRENSSVVMEIDSGLLYNQIAGKEIKAFFRDNEVYQTDVNNSATTIFFPEEEKKTDTLITITRKGMNRLYAGALRIYLDSGEITGITYFDQPDGVFYPMNEIPEIERFIRNFKWNDALRPKRNIIEGILPD